MLLAYSAVKGAAAHVSLDTETTAGPRIGIVEAKGAIGEAQAGVDSDKVVKLLKKYEKDDDVKAIVLRVDPQHDGLHVVVLLVLLQQLDDLVRIDARLCLADGALGLHDADARAGGGLRVQADVRGRALDRRVREQHEPEQHQEQAAEDDAQNHRCALVQPEGSFSNRGRLLPLGPCGYKRLPCPSGAS